MNLTKNSKKLHGKVFSGMEGSMNEEIIDDELPLPNSHVLEYDQVEEEEEVEEDTTTWDVDESPNFGDDDDIDDMNDISISTEVIMRFRKDCSEKDSTIDIQTNYKHMKVQEATETIQASKEENDALIEKIMTIEKNDCKNYFGDDSSSRDNDDDDDDTSPSQINKPINQIKNEGMGQKNIVQKQKEHIERRNHVRATFSVVWWALWLLLTSTITHASPAGGGNSHNKGSTQESTTLRRIKMEYKDAVSMGVAYNWAKGEITKCKTKTKKPSEGKQQQHPQYPLRLGPLTSNLRHWHFSFRGCGIYEAGIYHGRIILPKDYPATPPRVQLWTPSGRFIPRHDICLSASAYHPESWTPRWTVISLVQALRLHMLTNPQEIGGMTSSTDETLEYARQSLKWKLTWRVSGQKTITVDHDRMIRQGAFDIIEEHASDDKMEEDVVMEVEHVVDEEQDDDQQARYERDEAVADNDGPKTKPRMKKMVAPHQTTSSVLFKVIKVFASPTRMALLLLGILFWILNAQ